MKKLGFLLLFIPVLAFANTLNLGAIGQTATESVEGLALMVSAISYLCGMVFAVIAIVKFNAYKVNPTQEKLSTPIVLLLIATALVWLPTSFGSVATTLFGGTDNALNSGGNADIWG